ncbi:MAG: DNA polymerase III subunit delta [Clostridiales bacterium]
MEIKPLYIFYGEEEYLINKDIRFFREYFTKSDCSIEEFDGAKTSVETILEAAQTNPLFGEERLIIVNNAPWFRPAKKKESGKTKDDAEEKANDNLKKQRELLDDYFLDINEKTCLVFIATGLSRTLKLVKSAEKIGKVREYTKPKKWELPGILRQYLRKQGKNIGPKALEILVAMSGEELGNLINECDKLALHAGEKETISESDVLKTVSHSAQANNFQLSDALGKRDVAEVKTLAYALMSDMKPWEYSALFGYIVNQLRLLIRLKEMSNQGMNEREIIAATKVNSYRVKLGLPSAQKYHLTELTDGLKKMLEVELKMKTGKANFKDTFPVALISIAAKK